MKKSIQLHSEVRKIKLSPGQPEQDVALHSLDFIIAAIESNAENTKGIANMMRMANILDWVKRHPRDAAKLVVEDADYLAIKDSVDKIQWGPVILHFPEFLDAIANPQKVDDSQQKGT